MLSWILRHVPALRAPRIFQLPKNNTEEWCSAPAQHERPQESQQGWRGQGQCHEEVRCGLREGLTRVGMPDTRNRIYKATAVRECLVGLGHMRSSLGLDQKVQAGRRPGRSWGGMGQVTEGKVCWPKKPGLHWIGNGSPPGFLRRERREQLCILESSLYGTCGEGWWEVKLGRLRGCGHRPGEHTSGQGLGAGREVRGQM